MRRRTLLVLLLLAALGLGFAAGPHPCLAEQDRQRQERESPRASCHEAPASSQDQDDDGEGGCETVCPHACHVPAAAAAVRPTAFAAEPVSQLAARGSGRVLPPLAHPIDHVPLV